MAPKDRPHLLYIVRHAKSSWDDPSLDDVERPLSARGVRACALLAKRLRRTGVAPSVVLCSPARRARETAAALLPAFGEDTALRVDDALYGASVTQLLGVLGDLPATVPSAMVIGHNPGVQDLVTLLVDADAGDRAIRRIRAKFPTGAVASLGVHATWARIAPSTSRLLGYVVPRDLE